MNTEQLISKKLAILIPHLNEKRDKLLMPAEAKILGMKREKTSAHNFHGEWNCSINP
jgi:hypothetical protein